MMKQIFSCSIVFIGLLSCNSNESSESNLVEEVVTEVIEPNNDTVIVEEPIVEQENTSGFNTFDDYFAISTKEVLVEKFPKENLKDDISWYGEGEVSKQSTVVTNPENGQVVKYVWSDDDVNEAEWIEVYYAEGESSTLANKGLATKSGLSLGMSLADLAEWNQRPLKFLGFGWDYSGSVMVEKGDKLSDSQIQVNLGFDDYNDENNFLMGDVTLSSDDEKLKGKNIYVNELIYYYNKLDE